VRSLDALSQLLAAEPATASLRAASVGAPLRWAPDEQSFAEGWSIFTERHVSVLPTLPNPRRKALHIARALLALAPKEPDTPSDDDAPKVWDPPRVCRHLERAVAQSFQVLRRAAWLCLLANSSVAYREPGTSAQRFLVLRAADIVESGELAIDTALPTPRAQLRSTAQRAFNAASYDSLRILTTELKRILRDGGEVKIRLSRSHLLAGARLEQVLRLV
jgi:hypothetical protein